MTDPIEAKTFDDEEVPDTTAGLSHLMKNPGAMVEDMISGSNKALKMSIDCAAISVLEQVKGVGATMNQESPKVNEAYLNFLTNMTRLILEHHEQREKMELLGNSGNRKPGQDGGKGAPGAGATTRGIPAP